MNSASGPKIPSLPIFVLCSLSSLCSAKKNLLGQQRLCTKEHTQPRHYEIIRASAAHWKPLQEIQFVHCTLKAELSYFDRYLDVLVPKVCDVHRAADLSVTHTQSTKIAREGAVKDKRIAVSAIFFHAGSNVIMAWMPSLKPSASSSLT
jgi:hypothetical protein